MTPAIDMCVTITDLWHFASAVNAQKTGAERCPCGVDTYQTLRHGRGKRYRVSGTVDGQAIPTRAFVRKAEAEAYQRKLVRGEVPTSKNMGTDLLRTYAESFIARHYPNPRSRSRMTTNLNQHILPFFGRDVRLKEVTYLGGQEWLAHLRDTPSAFTGRPLAPKSIQLTFDFLNKVLSDAVVAEKLHANPVAKVERPDVPQGAELVVWEEELVLSLLAAIPDRDHGIALVAATSGLRKGECFGLAVEDIGKDRIQVQHQLQMERGRPALVLPKWRSVRSTGLHPDTAEALRLHTQRYATGITMECNCGNPGHKGKKWTLVFADERGRPHDGRLWDQKVWHPTLRAVGLDPAVPEATGLHQLRHHAASIWIAGLMPEHQVGRWLGHRDPQSTKKYVHLFEKAFEKAQDMLRGTYEGRSLLRAVEHPKPDQQGAA